jgi:hypothetical protein
MWICKVSDEREEKIREFEERNKWDITTVGDNMKIYL